MDHVDTQTPVRGTGRLIKSLNRSRILECLHQDGPLSRVELAERTGISLPAISHLVAELQEQDLIICLGKGKSSGGRPPVLFAYNFRIGYIVGLDVGGTKLAGGVSDLEGNLLATATIPTHDAGPDPVPLTDRLKSLIYRLLAEAKVEPAKLIGIGIGVPGIPDLDGGTVRLAPGLTRSNALLSSKSGHGLAPTTTNNEGTVPLSTYIGDGLAATSVTSEDAVPTSANSSHRVVPTSATSGVGSEIPLMRCLQDEFDCPIHLDNDVNTIVSGERWQGALQGVQDAVCVTVGTGIGAGLLLNGAVYRGARGAAGEIGYLLIGALGPIVRAAGYGPLESFAAGPGIARRYIDRLRERGRGASLALELADGRETAITARLIAEAAAQGEPLAIDIWRETTDTVGVALANLCLLIDPEMLVLGGGISRSPEFLFLDPVRRIVETMVPYPPVVVVSELGEKAGILGAVATVLDSRRNSISYVYADVGV